MSAKRKTVKRKTAKRKARRKATPTRPKPRDIPREQVRLRTIERGLEKTVRRLANTHGSPYIDVLEELLADGDGDTVCIECGTELRKSVCVERGCERKMTRDVYNRLTR